MVIKIYNESKQNRDNEGKFQIKGNQYKSKVMRLTLAEYEVTEMETENKRN